MAQMNPAEMEGMDQKAMMEQMNMQQLAQIQAMQDQYMKLQQSCEELVLLFYRSSLLEPLVVRNHNSIVD